MTRVETGSQHGRSGHRDWSELSPPARAATAVAGVAQLGLLVAAVADLRRREPAEVAGPRWVWGLVRP
jgi:hypothetical protein